MTFVCAIKFNVKTLASIFAKYFSIVIVMCVLAQTSAYFKGNKFSWHGTAVTFPGKYRAGKNPGPIAHGK